MGDNQFGQFGNGSTATFSKIPVKVQASGTVNFVTAGDDFGLFICKTGHLMAMGRNHAGQLGDGTSTDRSTAIEMVSSGVCYASASETYSAFIKNDGSLWFVGGNWEGTWGNGNTEQNIKNPTKVFDAGVQKVALGYRHTIFKKKDGSAWVSGRIPKGVWDLVLLPMFPPPPNFSHLHQQQLFLILLLVLSTQPLYLAQKIIRFYVRVII